MPLRRSTQPKKAPAYLNDFHFNVISTCNASHSDTLYPLSSVLSYSKLPHSHLKYTLSLSTNDEPTSYNQTIQHHHWIKAMDAELAALHNNHTWPDLPHGKKPIGSK